MSNWIAVFIGILSLLLSGIGVLVFTRLVYLGRERMDDRKEFEAANAEVKRTITSMWEYIRANQAGCTEMHLHIERNIGDLQARTEGNAQNLAALETRFWEKMRNVSDLANKAKDEVLARMAEIDRKFTDFLLHRSEDHKRQ